MQQRFTNLVERPRGSPAAGCPISARASSVQHRHSAHRQWSGHTQVNATDLRNLRYPRRGAIERLGRQITDANPLQHEIDAIVEPFCFPSLHGGGA
jgi:hypothetical protein